MQRSDSAFFLILSQVRNLEGWWLEGRLRLHVGQSGRVLRTLLPLLQTSFGSTNWRSSSDSSYFAHNVCHPVLHQLVQVSPPTRLPITSGNGYLHPFSIHVLGTTSPSNTWSPYPSTASKRPTSPEKKEFPSALKIKRKKIGRIYRKTMSNVKKTKPYEKSSKKRWTSGN